MMNNLQLEKQLVTMLPVMEVFHSIQGEGHHQGKPAWFIRLGGCDVGCVWCDVKESWPEETHSKMATSSIIEQLQNDTKLIIVTGGEPLMHPLSELTGNLKNKGFQLHLETSGAHPITGTWDWITLSPKKFKAPLPEIYSQANELKVVVYNKSDLLFAEKNAARVSKNCKLYLQPEWSRETEMIQLITNFILLNPAWQLSVQLHKHLNLP